MFAGDDDDAASIISCEIVGPGRTADQRAVKMHGWLTASEANRWTPMKRVSRAEQEFGWSGCAGGIRGRDDEQIKRDAQFEELIEARRRKRKERKVMEAAAKLDPGGLANGAPKTVTRKSYRPVFAPGEQALASIERTGAVAAPAPAAPEDRTNMAPLKGVTLVDRPRTTRTQSVDDALAEWGDPAAPSAPTLKRGKSLKDKVGAALGRLSSRHRKQSGLARAATTGGVEFKGSRNNHEQAAKDHDNHSGGLNGLVRKVSRKLVDPALAERQRRRVHDEYAPPKLSHVLVGDKSPFPPRPPLTKAASGLPSFDSAVRSGGMGAYARVAYNWPAEIAVAYK